MNARDSVQACIKELRNSISFLENAVQNYADRLEGDDQAYMMDAVDMLDDIHITISQFRQAHPQVAHA